MFLSSRLIPKLTTAAKEFMQQAVQSMSNSGLVQFDLKNVTSVMENLSLRFMGMPKRHAFGIASWT